MEASPNKRRWNWSVVERLRLFTWRHRVLFSVLYVVWMASMAAFLWLYPKKMPASMDLGLTVAVRSWLHQRTFLPVEKARAEVEEGRLDRARARLEVFVANHGDTQAGQIYTHAVSDAHELLAEVHSRQGRQGRAVKTLEAAVERTPLSWRLWAQLGRRRAEKGDLADAAEAYREAFKLTLDLPEVAEEYLGLLAELGDHESILWVADHFQRAAQRAGPLIEAKVGPPRSSLEQRAMDLAGIAVEHGVYSRSYRAHGLPRGPDSTLSLPGGLFADVRGQPSAYLQLRFHNVYGELSLRTLRLDTVVDGERRVVNITPGAEDLAVQHRDGSGGDHHIELRFSPPEGRIERAQVVYDCEVHQLSPSAMDIIAGARRNLAVRPR